MAPPRTRPDSDAVVSVGTTRVPTVRPFARDRAIADVRGVGRETVGACNLRVSRSAPLRARIVVCDRGPQEA